MMSTINPNTIPSIIPKFSLLELELPLGLGLLVPSVILGDP